MSAEHDWAEVRGFIYLVIFLFGTVVGFTAAKFLYTERFELLNKQIDILEQLTREQAR